MSVRTSDAAESFGDENGGFEGPDVETPLSDRPFVDTDGELDDSADSYVSPAREDDDTAG